MADATLQSFADALSAAFPGAALKAAFGEVALTVAPDALAATLTRLRDDPDFLFVNFVDCCGADYPGREKRFEVVHHLLSPVHNRRIRVKTQVAEDEACPSATDVFASADWFEREAWDLYGIPFSGHPDLRRILTDYGFDGHPLRKDFPLSGFVEVRYDDEAKRVVNEPVRLTQEFRTFDFLSPWEGERPLPGDEKAATAGNAKS
ncbi:MAG: NADH-quinone oxidoreductase subunit C [Bradyrhizobium sp.]|nr:NADH-quinone oxidoreductase subunit C [Bradyrhizobium sp.]MDE2016343.1 NADH-quinone oxidoreductase subunit C [Hyphomicrobiales bacterium]